MPPISLRCVSLGAGVQSTTLTLMAAVGEITPMPDCAIFADTQAEPRHVYEHLDWLETQLPFPVYRVTAGDLRAHIVASVTEEARYAAAPFYTESANPNGGALRRQCTREFKIAPIHKKMRELLGFQKGERIAGKAMAESWVGISLDEATRMKPDMEKWITKRYPLIDLRMTRLDCLNWLRRRGYPEPKKSACTFCPYHSDSTWRAMKLHAPDEWASVVALDRLIRDGVRGTEEKLYVHRSLRPLDTVDLSTLEDHGQLNLFENECEGMCGV